MLDYEEYSRRTTLKEALGSLYGFIGYWARKKEDEERYVGYLFHLMKKIIVLADYIRKVGTDKETIKELTDGIPRYKEAFSKERKRKV